MSSRRLAYQLLTMVWFAVGCADLSRGAGSGDAGASLGEAGTADGGAQDQDSALSFATPVYGLLVAACQPCHAQGEPAGTTLFLLTGDQMVDYASVSRFVDVSAPASSRLLVKMSGRGHGGGTLYAAGTPEYQAVLRWIQEGARP
jgi:hypothetical protein